MNFKYVKINPLDIIYRGVNFMKKIWIEDIKNYDGQEVTLHAWLYNKRSSGKLHFLQLRDGTGEIQAVVFKGNVSDFADFHTFGASHSLAQMNE